MKMYAFISLVQWTLNGDQSLFSKILRLVVQNLFLMHTQMSVHIIKKGDLIIEGPLYYFYVHT